MTGIPPILPDILQNQIAQLGLPNPMEGLPPGQQINPMMAIGDASQGPQGQGPINPIAGPAGGGGDGLSALFGGAPGQGGGADALSAAGGALAQSGASQGDFTPSTLTSIVNAVQAGRQSLEVSEAIAAEKRRKKATEDLLNSTIDGSVPEQIAALKKVRNSLIADGKDKEADAIDGMIQNLNPDEEFTTKSLGDGMFVTTNNNSGATRIGGEFHGDDSISSVAPGSKNNPWVRAQGINPATGTKEWMQYPKLDPLDITWQGLRVNEVEPEGANRFSEVGVKAAIGAEEMGIALDDMVNFFGTTLESLDEGFSEGSLTESTTPLQPLQNTLMASKSRLVSALGRMVSGQRAEMFRRAQELGKEAIGRISSGAAINEGEVARFESMLPQTAEDPELTFQKLIFMRDMRTLLATIAETGITDKQQIAEAIRDSGILERADPTINQERARGSINF